MRKTVAYWLAAVCVWLACSFSAGADVIVEPMDSFYEEHAEECVHVGRAFTANGPDGKVYLYKSPELPEVVATWENGYRASIMYTYEDSRGILWGVYDDYRGTVGWMPMEYMELIYDSISFQKEFSEEITEQGGELDAENLEGTIRFWKYPGSEECEVLSVDDTEDYLPEYTGVYVDGVGNRWGHVGYYFGRKDTWICINAPSAEFEQLYPDGAPQIGQLTGEGVDAETTDPEGQKDEKGDDTEAANPEGKPGNRGEEAAGNRDVQNSADRIVPQPDYSMMMLAIALVALVTVATAVLLLCLWKKRDKREGN